MAFPGLVGAKGQVLDLGNEFLVLARQHEAKANQARALRDIDEAAGIDDAPAKPDDVDVALLVDLAGRHDRRVEDADIVKMKLAGLADDGQWIGRDSQADDAGRDAAGDT